MNYHLMSYFYKAGLFAAISTISFLIPPKNVPGRVTVLVTTLLAQGNIVNTIFANVPASDGISHVITDKCVLTSETFLIFNAFLLQRPF